MSANMFLSLLLLLFVALKLTGYIAWSWWWVLAPFWIPLGFALLAGLVVFVLSRFESPEARAAREIRDYGDALRKHFFRR